MSFIFADSWANGYFREIVCLADFGLVVSPQELMLWLNRCKMTAVLNTLNSGV